MKKLVPVMVVLVGMTGIILASEIVHLLARCISFIADSFGASY